MTNKDLKNELPPKTCEIDRLVTLPKDIQKVLDGKKTATRRNGRYADVGEIMVLNGEKYIVNRVFSQTLGDVTEEDAKREGYHTLQEYIESILSIHPGMKWVPEKRIWVHEYSAINK